MIKYNDCDVCENEKVDNNWKRISRDIVNYFTHHSEENVNDFIYYKYNLNISRSKS